MKEVKEQESEAEQEEAQSGVQGEGSAKADRNQEALTAHLYQQISQLKVERDFLSGKSGL